MEIEFNTPEHKSLQCVTSQNVKICSGQIIEHIVTIIPQNKYI